MWITFDSSKDYPRAGRQTYCGARARLSPFDIRLKAFAVGELEEPVASWKDERNK